MAVENDLQDHGAIAELKPPSIERRILGMYGGMVVRTKENKVLHLVLPASAEPIDMVCLRNFPKLGPERRSPADLTTSAIQAF
jgi:hypothetical protein